tara:strand:- start:6290 stop:7129 length:840 start_codon:yes stop_codon:yes gene_type:complete
VKIQKKVFKGVTKLAKKAWKNKYIRAGLLIAAIATGVGAFAVAGATGAGAGGILAATGAQGASAFGALMKAGFVGFSGAAGTTAGLVGAGGSFGLSGSILAGGSAITPVAPVAPAAGGFSASLGAGAAKGGGTFIGGLGATPTGPMSLAPTAKTVATSAGKSGFLGTIKNTLKDGIYSGVKNLAAQGTYNLLMHGDIKGPDFEQDIPYVSGNSSGYYSGTYALPDSIEFTNANLGSDTIGSTYVNMLKNLNYGTGSLDYARHTNMALMRGIQVPQIQYA